MTALSSWGLVLTIAVITMFVIGMFIHTEGK